MPRITGRFGPGETPLIDVEIGYPTGLTAPGLSAVSLMVPLLIDTAARFTHIAKDVADALSLIVIGSARVSGSTANAIVETYLADLRFPSTTAAWSSLELRQFPNPGPRYRGVLGMDILRRGTLYVDGPRGEFTLTFP